MPETRGEEITPTMNTLRVIRAAITACVVCAASAYAAPYGDHSEYTLCKAGEKQEDVRVHKICFLNLKAAAKLLGTAVEGDQDLRQAAKGYRWKEFSSGAIVMEDFEIAFDCKTNTFRSRSQIFTFDGSSRGQVFKSSWDNDDTMNTEIETMSSYCPAEKGFIRVGTHQIKVKDMIRSQSVVNTIAKSPGGKITTLSIDCDKLVFRFGNRSKPIKPGTYGQKVFNVLCKK